MKSKWHIKVHLLAPQQKVSEKSFTEAKGENANIFSVISYSIVHFDIQKTDKTGKTRSKTYCTDTRLKFLCKSIEIFYSCMCYKSLPFSSSRSSRVLACKISVLVRRRDHVTCGMGRETYNEYTKSYIGPNDDGCSLVC